MTSRPAEKRARTCILCVTRIFSRIRLRRGMMKMMTSKMRLIEAAASWPNVSLMHLPLPAFPGIRMF